MTLYSSAAGFRKILKKFDKVTECQLQKKYMSTILLKSYPFRDETQTKLDEALQSIIPLYARVVTRGDTHEALRQLRIQLREHVIWERNTIWRDMIGLERKGWSGAGTGLNARRASGGGTGLDKPMLMQKELEDPDVQAQTVSTPLGRIRLPNWLSKEVVGGIIAVVAFIAILVSDFGDRVEERNCLAILVFASIFWALEVSSNTNEYKILSLTRRIDRSFRCSQLPSWFHSSLLCCGFYAQRTAKTADYLQSKPRSSSFHKCSPEQSSS